MANLPENPVWEAGIRQLELTDPVQGGPDGVDNIAPKQLANRTAYLKQEVEQRAPLASPAFTGTPTAPTQLPGNNSLRLANTAFVQAALAALVDSSPAALDTLNELAAALGNDPDFASTVTNALALKAPLDSPAMMGTPTAPTASPSDSSTKLATTAFVQGAPKSLDTSGWIQLWGGLILQWGRVTGWATSGDTNLPITFPIAFPEALLHASWTVNHQNVSQVIGAYVANTSLTGMTLYADKNSTESVTIAAFYFALGY